MSDAPTQSLSRAYELIEADRLDEARDVLEPLLATHEDDPDVWWLYAHAVEDVDTARTALNNLMRVDPDYPGAAQLMQKLEQKLVVQGELDEGDLDRARPPEMFADLPDEADIEDLLAGIEVDEAAERDYELDLDFEDYEEDEEDYGLEQLRPQPRRRGRLLALVLLAVVLVVAIVLVVLDPFEGEEQPAPTISAQLEASPTVETTRSPTNTPRPVTDTPVPTEVTDTEVPAQSAGIIAALDNFELARETTEVVDSNLGSTLLASVCTQAGSQMRETLNGVMVAITQESQSIADDVDAIGVRLIDCEQDSILNIIGVNVEDAQAFANGTITEDEYRGRWRAIAN